MQGKEDDFRKVINEQQQQQQIRTNLVFLRSVGHQVFLRNCLNCGSVVPILSHCHCLGVEYFG